MKKVLLNKCYGGFDVSQEGYKLYAKKLGLKLYHYKLNHDDWTYEKVGEDDKYSYFSVYLTHDYGEKVDTSKIDRKYLLDLNSDYRENSILIEVVEELGDSANGPCGKLAVVEIPDDVAADYVIDNYDGIETLHKRVQEW